MQHPINQQRAVLAVEKALLRIDVAALHHAAPLADHLAQEQVEGDAARLVGELVFRHRPRPRVAHHAKLEIGGEVFRADVAAADVFVGIEMGKPRRPLGRIAVGPHQQASPLLPGEVQLLQEHHLDALAGRFRHVDEDRSEIVAKHPLRSWTAGSPRPPTPSQ